MKRWRLYNDTLRKPLLAAETELVLLHLSRRLIVLPKKPINLFHWKEMRFKEIRTESFTLFFFFAKSLALGADVAEALVIESEIMVSELIEKTEWSNWIIGNEDVRWRFTKTLIRLVAWGSRERESSDFFLSLN